LTRRLGDDRGVWIGLSVAIGLAAVVRLVPILATDFPLNDGALFLSMITAIRDHGYALPETASYNRIELPFVYPPAALYLAAAVIDVTGISQFDALRFIPLAFSLATVPAVFLLFRQLLKADAPALLATAAFGLIPRSYDWVIAGGGITRAPGLLLAILSMAAAARMFDRGGLRWPVLTGVAGGAATLCHPESGVFAALSILVLAPFQRMDWRSKVGRIGLAAGLGALVASPWLALVLGRHGTEPLLGAVGTGGAALEGAFRLLTFRYTDGYLELFGVVGALGLFVCLRQSQWLLPLWTAVIFLAGSRASLTYASIPVAAAVAVAAGAFFRLLRLSPPVGVTDLARGGKAAVLVILLLVAGVGDSLASAWRGDSPLHSLTADERAGMEWVAANTAPDATVLVIAGRSWPLDAVGEWFPVLAERRSSSTVQGSEWMGPGAFLAHRNQHAWLLNCASRMADDCVTEWSRVVEPVDYVFVAGQPCCRPYLDRVVAGGSRVVYAAPVVAIAELGP
jgi:hypothetical protein